MNNKYEKVVFYSEEDEGFIAEAVDLPGCSAFGKDEISAIKELETAIKLWIESARKNNIPIPPPKKANFKNRKNVSITLQVPEDVKERYVRFREHYKTTYNGPFIDKYVIEEGERAFEKNIARNAQKL
jgi:predicted RNase H-like HicB family nuclease